VYFLYIDLDMGFLMDIPYRVSVKKVPLLIEFLVTLNHIKNSIKRGSFFWKLLYTAWVNF